MAAKKTSGKKPPLGSGARFKAVEESARKSGAADPKAVAASVGMKKYGKGAMQKMAAAGRKNAAGKSSGKKK